MSAIPLSLIIILGALTAIGPVSTDIYLPAFPALAAHFNASAAEVQRTLAASFLGMTIGQAFYGPLSDRFGRRLPLAAGMAGFALASVACALATGILQLTAFRFLQTLGGCAGVVVARAVVRDLAEGPAMIRLMARLMLVFALAPILGPLLGGWMVSQFGWRAVFWVLTGYGLACVAAILFVLPESLPPSRRSRGGVRDALRVYGRLLGSRRFMGEALGGILPMAGLFAYLAGSPFVFMQLHGVSPQDYGYFFGANAAGLMLVSQVVSRLAQRVPATRLLTISQVMAASLGLALLLVAGTGLGGFWGMVVVLWFYIASLGGIMPVATAQAMAGQSRAAGSASAVLGVLQFGLGMLSGLAVSLLQDGTAMAMALPLACGGLAGLVVRRVLVR